METITRVGLCLFSFDESNQNHNYYKDNNTLLSKCKENCLEEYRDKCFTSPITPIGYIKYNEKKRLYFSVIGYKKHIFFGFFYKKDGVIVFNDDTNTVCKLTEIKIIDLFNKFSSSCLMAKNKQEYPIKELRDAWIKTYPLLDKIVEFDNLINNLKEDIREKMEVDLIYNDIENQLVQAYENGDINKIMLSYDKNMKYIKIEIDDEQKLSKS